LAVLFLTSVLFVEGLPLVKTSFGLGSETGFCIDIESSGSSIFWDSVHLSSCTEDTSEGDLQQMQFNGEGPITIEGHERCLEVKPKSGGWDVVFRPCWSALEAQSFTFEEEGCMIKNEKVGLCLAAGSTVSSNGDELTRILQVVDCDSVSNTLLSWDVHPSSSDTKLTCLKPKSSWKFPQWAAVIFAVFGIITCWCACWFLFCPSYCKEKQKQMELIVRKKSPNKIRRDENPRCPAGHYIRVVPRQGKGSCSNCHGHEFREDTRIYYCQTCNWIICASCYSQIRTRKPSAPYAPLPTTPESKETSVLEKSNIANSQPPIKKSVMKAASMSPYSEPRVLKEIPVSDEGPNLLTRIRRSIFGTAEQATEVKDGESSDITTPERISREIRSVVREELRRSRYRRNYRSPGDYRHPRDYHYRYSPRRRSPRRYRRWSDSSTSTSTEEEESEYYPSRRSRQQRRWRREYV